MPSELQKLWKIEGDGAVRPGLGTVPLVVFLWNEVFSGARWNISALT